MQIFLQRADSDPDPLGHIALEDALALYRQHDWDSEIFTEERLRSDGRPCCSPSMDWVSDSGAALTMVPTSRGSTIVYRSGEKHRFLGVIPTPADSVTSVSGVPEGALREILLSHYRGDGGVEKLIVKAGDPLKLFS
jgi:hypothetical protein